MKIDPLALADCSILWRTSRATISEELAGFMPKYEGKLIRSRRTQKWAGLAE